MFTDNPKTPPVTKRRAVTATKRRWSDEQKLELIKMYLLTGNLALSSAALKIPEITARQWKVTSWWKEREHELRIQKDFKVSGKLEKIIEKSMVLIEDRLDHGDFFYNRESKQLERKPVTLLQAHKVASDMLDRRELLERKLDSGQSQEIAIDKFQQLADKFEALSKKITHKPPVEVTDVIFVTEGESDALHDEREEGLQEGVPEVPFETETDQEQDEEDYGPTASECEWTYEER